MMWPRDAVRGSALERPWAVLFVVILVAVGVALFMPFSRMDEWIGWLPGTISIFESIAIVLPTFLAAVSAWISGQPRAHGMSEWAAASATTSGGRVLPALVIVGTAALVVEVVVVAVLFTVSAHFGLKEGWVATDLLLVIPAVAAYVGVWAVVGAWLGSKFRRDVALLAAALLPYLWYALSISFFVGKPIEALTVGDPGTFDYLRPTAGAVILRTLVWLVLLVLLCVSISGQRRLARLFAWMLSAVTAITILLAPPLELIPGVHEAVCAGNAPKACLEGSYRTTMARYREAIDDLWPSVPTAIRPTVIASIITVVPPGEQALIVPPISANGLASARLVDQQRFAAWVGDELFLAPCRSKGETGAALSLLIWWRLENGIPLDGSSHPGDADYTTLIPGFERLHQRAVEFAGRSGSDKELWFEQNREGVLGCTAPDIGS